MDCNCNDCGFYVRNLEKYNAAIEEDKVSQFASFNWVKQRRIDDANELKKTQPEKAWHALDAAKKMSYSYRGQRNNVHYGLCTKFNKDRTILPNTLQLDTQECFVHRKMLNNEK